MGAGRDGNWTALSKVDRRRLYNNNIIIIQHTLSPRYKNFKIFFGRSCRPAVVAPQCV